MRIDKMLIYIDILSNYFNNSIRDVSQELEFDFL